MIFLGIVIYFVIGALAFAYFKIDDQLSKSKLIYISIGWPLLFILAIPTIPFQALLILSGKNNYDCRGAKLKK